MKPIKSNRSSRSTKRKVWQFSGNGNVQTHKRDRIVGLLQEFTRPEPTRGTLMRPDGLNNIRRGDEDNDDNESFHRAMGCILRVAQLFGLLPVSGLRSPTPTALSFTFYSIHVLYTVIILVMLTFMAVLAFVHMVRTLKANTFEQNGGVAAATAGAMFYTNSLLGTVLFFWLAPRWVTLQQEWRRMERNSNSSEHRRPRLRWKFAVISSMIMIPAVIEHILSLVINMSSSNLPNNGVNATWTDYMRSYSNKSHGFILSSLNYTLGLGFFLFIISKIATFTWNFTDLFIMLVSTGLADRYQYLNEIVLTWVSTDRSPVDWAIIRGKYATLSSLVKQTDNNISPIILLSFGNNLYFICIQLLNGLSPVDGFITSLYFFGSFVFLIGRTIAVTLLTARINDQSKLLLPAIYNCPASNFNSEAQRLQQQLTSDDVAMTGLRFFSITRNFMLAVAGAIITYEVVLLQFNVAMKK